MNLLQGIVEQKKMEVLKRKMKRPLSNLETFESYGRRTNRIDLSRYAGRPGFMAEFKRKSPSRGVINNTADPVEVAGHYLSAGVAAMSILTDRIFFGGSFADIQRVRETYPDLVLLRKDFILDPYQLHEARAYGADMVLLIAGILDKSEVEELALQAGDLDLQVLFEVHGSEDLEKYHPSIGWVGVNNRDLKTFQVDTRISLSLIGDLPGSAVPVSESGLHRKEEVDALFEAGYRFFLMGERFMKSGDPGHACRQWISQFGQNE